VVDQSKMTTEGLQYGCGSPQPSYLKDKLGIKVRRDAGRDDEDAPQRDGTNSNSFSAQEALEILRKISRTDVEMLGLDPGTLFMFPLINLLY